jgi:hypothetical protein
MHIACGAIYFLAGMDLKCNIRYKKFDPGYSERTSRIKFIE